MNGYVAQRRSRFYAVIYEGRDPVTGKELRRWHPAGTDRAEAERLAAKLAAKEQSRIDAVRTLTFGAYLTSQWLPAKKLHLATSTYRAYERNVQRHILPTLGRVGLRRLRYQQIESLYDALLNPAEGRGLAPKTVYEIHLSSADRSPMLRAEGWSPATSPWSPEHPSNGPSRRSKVKRGRKRSFASSCAPPPGIGTSRSSGSPP
jgi:hypothetical protein